MAGKAMAWLRSVTVLLFATAITAGLFLPVYSDEIGWRFQERAGFDGVDKLFSDICGPITLARPPFFMMPARYFSALFNAMLADPLYVRLSGILYALAWFALVLAFIRRVARSSTQAALLGTLAAALMALGNQPLLLVMSRPEQPVLLALTGALLLAARGWAEAGESATPAHRAWVRSVGVLMLAIVAVSYHLKGVFLVPLFAACLFYASHGRAAHPPRLIAGAALLVASGLAAHYWIARFQCPDDALLRAHFARNNFGAILTGIHAARDVWPVVGKVIENISLFDYVRLAAPKALPLSYWLPAGQIDASGAKGWSTFLVWCWGAALAAGTAALLVAGWQHVRRWRSVGGERLPFAWGLEPRLVMAALLLITALGWSATQIVRNVYEASFVPPLLMLAVLLALSAPEQKRWLLAGQGMLASALALSALVSVPLIATLWGPSLIRSSKEVGYIAWQPYSVPPFGFTELKLRILALSRQCGIPEPSRANAVMIDEATYFAFMESHLPQHRLGVLSIWNGSITDPVAYLKSRGSDGAILGCHLLPPELRARAQASGPVCCLAPPNW